MPPRGFLDLLGKDISPTRERYPHQIEAGRRLDDLALGAAVSDRSGLLVLPTGAGKTSTIVDWLVPRLAADPTLRVLWLAHQEELLEQAARAFQSAAERQALGFTRRLRVISSNGSASSTLAESNLDIAIITWQSLNRGWAQQRSRLNQFLQRPTVVVVDEAHHAAAAGYQSILADIGTHPAIHFIGLTATPWPGQGGAAQRLRNTFPVDILTRTPEEMHEAGILATPIFHTVDTGESVQLTATELAQSKRDLPASILRKLATDGRDDLLVRIWTANPAGWGKTLVFATGTDHADRVGDKLQRAGAEVRVAHFRSAASLSETLAWFREQRTPAVLVSVGMLTEGVDVPDARTAFLARPTTSRILMRQMIGRVLRGEQAGGDGTAHIVYFRDHWLNFDDALEPGELPGIDGNPATTPTGSEKEHRLPPVLDEDSGNAISEDVLAQIRRMYSRRIAHLPLDPATTSTVLVGYYQLIDLNVPVMEHQVSSYRAVVAKALMGASFVGKPALSMFDSDHPPYPTDRSLRALLSHMKSFQTEPPFVPLKAQVSPVVVARRLRAEDAMTDDQRERWLRIAFESSLARLAYESFEHFEEAVERELRELRRADRAHTRRPNLEQVEPARQNPTLPRLSRSTSRDLPTMRFIVESISKHLAGESVLERLDAVDLPALDWTTRTSTEQWPTAWAYWTIKNTGQLRGTRVIRVNRALRAPKSQVSDELLAYLVFHEMLHDLLPGQGHDAEFRRLESRWPDAEALDIELDTLRERYQMPAATAASGSQRKVTA